QRNQLQVVERRDMRKPEELSQTVLKVKKSYDDAQNAQHTFGPLMIEDPHLFLPRVRLPTVNHLGSYYGTRPQRTHFVPFPARRDRLEPRGAVTGAYRHAAQRHWTRSSACIGRKLAPASPRRGAFERSVACVHHRANRRDGDRG